MGDRIADCMWLPLSHRIASARNVSSSYPSTLGFLDLCRGPGSARPWWFLPLWSSHGDQGRLLSELVSLTCWACCLMPSAWEFINWFFSFPHHCFFGVGVGGGGWGVEADEISILFLCLAATFFSFRCTGCHFFNLMAWSHTSFCCNRSFLLVFYCVLL